jgi:hypothetical protein
MVSVILAHRAVGPRRSRRADHFGADRRELSLRRSLHVDDAARDPPIAITLELEDRHARRPSHAMIQSHASEIDRPVL